MRLLIVLTSLAAVAFASNYEELFLLEWKAHTLTHHIDSKNATENLLRMNIYLENRIKQAQHNVEYAQGKVGFKVGVNKFTHMTATEVADLRNGYNRAARKGLKQTKSMPQPKSVFAPPKMDCPNEWDWRKKGAVTDVKDQGNCGSCYAFSATGALEGQQFLKAQDNPKLVNISEQNIVDCSSLEGNSGCNGGLPESSFLYIADNDGIDSETAYPYTAKDSGTCNYTIEGKVATDEGFVQLPSGSEEALMLAVVLVGPISVGIDASHCSFHSYISGVYNDPSCGNTTESLDHGVLVVGFGTTEYGEDYWIVKNSWGANWGEKGYIRMARNKDNACGIATRATFPIV